MGERWDNFKQEMAWPVVKFQQWYENDDNRFVFWATTIAACVVTCIFYTGAGLGLRAIARAVSDNTEITVVSGNPCLNPKGLVKAWAPASCYADGLARTAVQPTEKPQTIRNNDATISSPNDVAYNPPCKKDGLPGCSDAIYSKRLVEGEIVTATFNDDEKTVADGHLQPDFTEVKFYALIDDQESPPNEKFCGNVLDKFTPGKKFRMVINESKQSDYNGCYMIDVTVLTFGGDKYVPRRKK